MTDEAVNRLPDDRAWALLGANSLGRLAVAAGGEIDIFPINYVVDGRSIVFRTGPGTKLVELTIHSAVAFEIDGFSDTEAWSVVLKGTAAPVESHTELETIDGLGLVPWLATHKPITVRITASEVSARRFLRGPDPGPGDD